MLALKKNLPAQGDYTEAYLEPRQTSMIKLFVRIANS